MTLPQRRKKPKMGTRDDGRIRSNGHLQWVRLQWECAAAGHGNCNGKIQAAHVRKGTDGGLGVKPSDCWVIPLCAAHHAEQHALGEDTFAAKYGLDLHATAKALWRESPHRVKHERKSA